MSGKLLFFVLFILTRMNNAEPFWSWSFKNVEVSPVSQLVKENEDAVIDCRGRFNGKVVWMREDGKPLPEGSEQINGRLRMFGLRPEDAGVFICYYQNEHTEEKSFARSYITVSSATATTLAPFEAVKIIHYTESGLVAKSSTFLTSPAPIFTSPKYSTSGPLVSSTCTNCTKTNSVLCLNCKNETTIAESLFDCADGQIINKSLVCNRVNDCPDGSDESNCASWPPKITVLPKAKVEVFCNERASNTVHDLVLECQFVGNPVPLIKWKKYEGHVPSKCRQISINGRGVLTCPNFQQSDQGSYSCIAENSVGSSESQPKSVAKCSNSLFCNGFRVTTQEQIEHCLECFCSGKTKTCQNIKSNKTVTKISFPETKTELFASDEGQIQFIPSDEKLTPDYEVRKSSKEITYCSLLEKELKDFSFLKSFGRNINIPRYLGKIDFLPSAPDMIIQGNNISLMYAFNMISHYARAVDVRFWPGNWHHLNRTTATRHDLMRVLSKVEAIHFRCEYQEGKTNIWSSDATISLESSVITDFSKSVSYVEKCLCPRGYDGLSCETCASGFVRKNQGNDFICEQEKPMVCKVGWSGKNCDTCDTAKGYYLKGTECVKNSCNPKGSLSLNPDSKGKCQCKESVTGDTCDKCKSGFFHLDQSAGGCLKCWCNGATSECKSSSLYRTTISSTSLGGYNSSDGRNFWLLPSVFSGSRLTSYGGYLNYSMKYLPNIAKQVTILSVELMSTDEITLSYMHSTIDKTTNKNEKSWSVRLVETNWKKIDNSAVSRGEFLTVLSKLKAIYVESPYHLSSGSVNLTSAWMSSASTLEDGSKELALEVEECSCPAGYTGMSCEKCTEGYYKSRRGNISLCLKCNCENCNPEKGCQDCPQGTYRTNSPKEKSKPVCEPCPCNGNEVDCAKDDFGTIFCRCKKGFSGMYCQHKISPLSIKSQLKVTISPSRVKGKKVGAKITFNCSYDSSEEMKMSVIKNYNKGRQEIIKDIYEGAEKFGHPFGSVKNFEIVLDNGLENVECLVHNVEEKEVGRVMAVVENLITQVEPVKITNCYQETIQVKVNESKELICQATGNPKPSVSWYRTKGEGMAEEVDTTVGVHSTGPLSLQANGTIYSCIAENSEGDRAICTTVLIVREACETVNIIPKSLRIKEGETIQLECKTTASGPVTWSRLNGVLPFFRYKESNGYLNITDATVQDSGTYICKANGGREEINKTVSVIVEEKKIPPTVSIPNDDVTLKEGDNFTVVCVANGKPFPAVTWKKTGEISGGRYNVVIRGATLTINRATPENSGLYECEAKSSAGKSVAHILIEVEENKVAPKVKIQPVWTTSPVEGSKATFNCLVLEGLPAPTLQWWRQINNQTITYAKGKVLEFQNVSRNDAGKYVCIARNSAGSAEASMNLEVLVPPTIEVSETEVVAHVNDEITVKCSATGYPRPKANWIKGAINKRKRNLRENEFLTTLDSAEITVTIRASYDLKELICVAENEAGKVNKSVTINVLYSGGSSQLDTLELVQLGSHFELMCEFPSTNGKLVWEKVNGRLQGDECHIPNGLMIPSVQIQHNGTYVCRPENKTTEKKTIILMVVGFVPKFTQSPKSYMILPATLNSFKELRTEISFKTNAEDGLLIVKSHNTLFSLFLKNGKINLRLHSDKEKSLDIKSKIHLKLGVWYSLVAAVSESLIDMTVYDNVSIILERKTEHLKDFKLDFGPNLRTHLYLGGAPSNDVTLRHRSFFTHVPSLDGCISRLIIDRHEFDIVKESSFSMNANLCKRCSEESDPCKGEGKCFDAPTQYGFLCTCPNKQETKESRKCPLCCVGRGCETQLDLCKLINPCKRKDLHECHNRISSLECECAFGYSGTTCEKVEQYSFCVKGDGYVTLPSYLLPRAILSIPETIKMVFTLYEPDGLLLWQGNTKNYLSISIYRRHVEYVYSNQNVSLKITGDHQLPLNEKILMTIRRVNGTVFLEVGSHSYKGSAKFTTNRVTGDIYLGNTPNGTLLKEKTPGLNGCIHFVSFGGHSKVNLHEYAMEKLNVVLPSQSDVSYDSEGSMETENNIADYDYYTKERRNY